jgi:acyl-CoA hydrolase
MTEIVLPNDTNMLGNLLGGRLMHFIDLTGRWRRTGTRAPTW